MVMLTGRVYSSARGKACRCSASHGSITHSYHSGTIAEGGNGRKTANFNCNGLPIMMSFQLVVQRKKADETEKELQKERERECAR